MLDFKAKSRPTRMDIRREVVEFLKDRECWASRKEIIAHLQASGIDVPPQISVVLENMVKNGWLKKGKQGNEFRGVKWYLVDAQKCQK